MLKANRLSKLLLMFRETVHSTLLTLSSDLPLVSAATSSASRRGGGAIDTPLEVDTAAFLTQQAHLSRFIMAVRELDTGAANDVSGVLRVTRGGSSISNEEVGEEVEVAKEMEALFLVQRDGGVKVFERGGGG